MQEKVKELLLSKKIALYGRERKVALILFSNMGKLTSKQSIQIQLQLEQIDVGLNAVEVYVHRLRKKLIGHGYTILTVRGEGYKMTETKCT